ncbi:ABC transporter ATP-binding protein [Georgenia sp. EYE_87]|uniref:ABC transporter ATP-binding protein n=1 Tax=Georgenia sp. EYE_87 TaxID=2853448 RepID=UPI002003025D|nr:ABC transporter ATP-binding protein [Georgenia sp. EYE_87]MCK6210668.1 ABC transporter ATP-binding protein [Georgenia sp. EYE_87]
MDPVITVQHLRKTFGATVAVEDVSLTVGRGEIVGILGPNGAGKTTTVEIIAGLTRPDGGRVEILGHDPQRDPAAVRQVLGVQLQESRLPARIRVEEALRLYASFYPEPADVDELIVLLGREDRRRTAFDDLSGGQQQRLSIALALVGRPQVVVLDELTTGLDPRGRRETWALVERVRDTGVTVLLVTHFMDEAEHLCDRVVVIDAGRVVAEGTPAELTAAGAEPSLRLRLPADAPAGIEDALRSLPEVAAVVADDGALRVRGDGRVLPAVVAALDERGVVPTELTTLTRSLEDVFVDVTGVHLEEAAA